MSLGVRVAVGFLVLLALMALVGAYQLAVIAGLEKDSRHLSEFSFAAGRLSLQLRRELARLRDLTEKLRVLRDPEYARELDGARERARRSIAELRGHELSAEERAEVEWLSEQWARYAEEAPQLEARLLEWGSGQSVDPMLRVLDDMSERVGVLEAASRDNMRRIAEAAARRAGQARLVSALAWIAGTLAAVVATAVLLRSVLGPLRELQRGAGTLGGGDLSHRVRENGPPEFRALARDFNAMANRLEDLDRLKREFVATVSHELKAPLASMQEISRLLLDGALGPLARDQEEMLRLSQDCGERLSRMLYDLLDLARLEAGAVEYDFRPHDLAETVRGALAEFEGSIRAKRLRTRLDLPDEPLLIEADAELLQQVCRNLLSNAVKFTPEDGVVEVSARRSGDASARSSPSLVLSVADSGPGIPDSEKERIFDRFHRADDRAKGSQGTGLGLAIAANVVAGHGGEIWVEDRPGGGSVFVVRLRALEGANRDGEAAVELSSQV